jgi:NDP-sugar pyrophosphorylase family protein
MVLAAGLGTRLRLLTNDRPKALVEIGGQSLLQITLSRLRGFGIQDVIINTHHFADKVQDYLTQHKNFGMNLAISQEEELLDTGGGLKKAGYFFLDENGNTPFLLHNVDIVTTIDIPAMVEFHRQQGALATLAVQNRSSSRHLLFDQAGKLCGRRVEPEGQTELAVAGEPLQPLAFCGVHVISPRLLTLLDEDGAFSIIASYLRLAARGEKIMAFPADQYYWHDVGKPESIAKATEDLRQGKFHL